MPPTFSGSYLAGRSAEQGRDVAAAVQLLQARPDIDPRRVGLHGMSQGGWIAPLAAKRAPDVAFIIAESAPAMTPVEHERLRVPYQLAADGFSADLIAHAVSFMDQKFEVARTGDGWGELQTSMERGAREGWLSYVNPPPSLENLRWNWEHILTYDPAPALQALTPDAQGGAREWPGPIPSAVSSSHPSSWRCLRRHRAGRRRSLRLRRSGS